MAVREAAGSLATLDGVVGHAASAPATCPEGRANARRPTREFS